MIKGDRISDEYLQIKVGGDQALFQALGHILLKKEEANPGSVVDQEFVDTSTKGFEEYRAARAELDWEEIERATGLERAEIEHIGELLAASKATIFCWALGITQQPHSVDTIKEIVNLLLLQGNFGKPGAGACPVRGHSNVQGDRTFGIWEKPAEWFLEKLDAEFGIESPREHGYDSTESMYEMAEGNIDVFVSLGGNLAMANSDTALMEAGLKKTGLTVHISTKPNRSHVVHGRTSIILPTLGRSDKDDKHPGGAQFLSVENSMSVVSSTQGRLEPVSDHLLAEPVIIARMAEAVFGPDHIVDWKAMADDYDVIRDHASRVVPGTEDFNERVRDKYGFVLPNPPRDRRSFATPDGKAAFTVRELEYLEPPELPGAADHALPRPVQHHLLRPGRPLPRHLRRPPGHPHPSRGPGRDRLRGPGCGRCGLHVQGGGAPGRAVPPGGLPDGAWLRGCLLPGGQRPGAPRPGGPGVEHPRLQGHDGALRAGYRGGPGGGGEGPGIRRRGLTVPIRSSMA